MTAGETARRRAERHGAGTRWGREVGLRSFTCLFPLVVERPSFHLRSYTGCFRHTKEAHRVLSQEDLQGMMGRHTVPKCLSSLTDNTCTDLCLW